MNRTELRRRLTGISIENRIPIIQKYFQELSKKEFEKYKKFYETSVNALIKYKGVTRARSTLQNKGQLNFCGQMHYSLIHQMACVAATNGKEIRTPSTEMESNGVKTKQNIRRNRQGKNIGRLMEQKPAKLRFSKRPYDNPD